MKKLFTVVMALMISASAFALDVKFDSISLHFAVPFCYENSERTGSKVETTMTSIGFGFETITLYTEHIGLYVNMDFFFPQALNVKTQYGTVKLKRSDYESLWGLTALMAPAIPIIFNEKMLFTVSPGIHVTALYTDTGISTFSYYLGIGVNVQDSIFFTDKCYFTFGADIAYDFLGKMTSGDASFSGKTKDLVITPRIGIGFRFK